MGETAGAQRVLLVEDDPVSLKLMRDVLRARGYQTIDATDGLTALEQIEQQTVDLVVLDLGLPGIDGIEVARRLRARPHARALHVLAVTAYVMPGDLERAREAGCDACLTKPLSFARFVQVVDEMLQGAPAPGE